MSCLPEQPAVSDRAESIWRTAPALLQQTRRFHLESCGGRRAKRALFGQPDREETRRFVKEELAAIRAADQQKYNFDFSAMRPLAGPYEWQPVAAGEVSAAYQLGRLQSGLHQHRSARRLDFDAPLPAAAPAVPADSSPAGLTETSPAAPVCGGSTGQPRPAAVSSNSSSPLVEALARRASPPPRPTATAPRQSSITDFLRNRKRTSAFSCGDDSTAKRLSVSAAGGGGTSQQAAPAPAPASDTAEPSV